MKPRAWMYPLIALFLLSGLLAGCGVEPPAQAEPGQVVDILPDPPPMPAGAPLPTAVVPAAPEPAPGLASAAQVLSADFSSTDLSAWTVIDSYDALLAPSLWAVDSGRLAQQGDYAGVPHPYATALVTGEPSWRDYSVSAAAYVRSNDEMGVVARASEAGHYAFAVRPGDGPKRFVLARFDAARGAYTELATAQGRGFTPEQWHTVRLDVRGSALIAYFDGAEVLRATDTTLPTGQAGVYGYAQGGLLFDTFSVQTLPSNQ